MRVSYRDKLNYGGSVTAGRSGRPETCSLGRPIWSRRNTAAHGASSELEGANDRRHTRTQTRLHNSRRFSQPLQLLTTWRIFRRLTGKFAGTLISNRSEWPSG